MVILQTVRIPGYAEAVRKETHSRDTAFLDALECVCGLWVHPLCLRSLTALETARNGHIEPCIWESPEEEIGHAIQVLYFCRPGFRVPRQAPGFWATFRECRKQVMFSRQVLRYGREKIVPEVQQWLQDSMMDAPSGGGEGIGGGRTLASYPTYIIDKFAEAHLPFNYDEIMTMPLRRLWQHWRLAVHRLDGISLANPSDKIRTDYLASQHARN